MINNSNIKTLYKNIPVFCINISSLLSNITTTEPVFALAPPDNPIVEEEHRRLLRLAQTAQRRQEELRNTFPAPLFRDANWTIMLTCFTALLEGRTQCVKHIQSLLEDSHTAILRHIDVLEAHELVGRQRDPMDGRRTLVLLTGRGAAAMAHYVGGLAIDGDDPDSFAPIGDRYRQSS